MKIPNYLPIVNIAVGILTIATPYINSSATQTVNMTITGVLLVAIGIVAMVTYARSGMNYWSIVNLVAGLWLLLSIQQEHRPVMVWSNIVLGTLAIVTALVSIVYARAAANPAERRIVNYVPIINIAIGILTIVAPYANHDGALETNLTASGGILIVLGLLALGMQAMRLKANYFAGINVLVGFWLLVALGSEGADPALLWTTSLLAVACIMTGFVALPYEQATKSYVRNSP